MKNLLLLLFILFGHVIYAQQLDINELIRLRSLKKVEIENFLLSKNSNWVYSGFANDKHSWILNTGSESTNIMLILSVSLESSQKNGITVMTAEGATNQRIMDQILKYKMKKIGSQTKDTGEGKILVEDYEGDKFNIRILKAHNNNGDILVVTNLTMK